MRGVVLKLNMEGSRKIAELWLAEVRRWMVGVVTWLAEDCRWSGNKNPGSNCAPESRAVDEFVDKFFRNDSVGCRVCSEMVFR